MNNADRKGGHLLPTGTGRIFAVDHGVCFAATDKLRTLLWNWAGEPLAGDESNLLRRLRSDLDNGLGVALADLLTPDEIEATAARADHRLARGTLPVPDGRLASRPWPPF